MGLFDIDDNIHLENADMDCEPQNEFANKKQVKKIDEYLDPGEKVHFLARSAGEQFEIDGDNVDNVLAQRTAATDKRVVIKKKKNPFGYESQSIRYENISSVDLSSGLVKTKLRIETSSKVYGIGVGQLSDDAAEAMCDFIRTKMSQAHESSSANQSSEDDPLDKLERLRDLKEDGVISEDEFNEKKAQLLDQI